MNQTQPLSDQKNDQSLLASTATENLAQPSQIIRGGLNVEIREPSLESPGASTPGTDPILDFIASSARLDRFDEIVEASGWRLDAYRRNPVFQNAHQYDDIIFTLGKALITEVRAMDGREVLFQRIEFAVNVNPLARIAYGLYRGKFLNAVSVGFLPLRWENGGPDSAFRRRYLEQELLEVSAVGIPANPEALQLGLKSGAIAAADLRETAILLQTLLRGPAASSGPAGIPASEFPPELIQLARDIHTVMQRG